MSDTDSLVEMDRPAFVHDSVQLFGKISVSEGVSIWPNAVARAEQYEITIGPYTNVQDFVMLHVGDVVGTHIGAYCSVTHHCTLHGCQYHSRTRERLITMVPLKSSSEEWFEAVSP